MSYTGLLERERMRLIWVSDAIVDDNPLWLLRLPNVDKKEVHYLHTQLKALVTQPVFYEQIYTALRDAGYLFLLEDANS